MKIEVSYLLNDWYKEKIEITETFPAIIGSSFNITKP